jgi:Tol biopolymer transport system component
LDDPQDSSDGGVRIAREGRLDSWKKIAAYLKRDVSTVQRWERREGMPVHRHLHDKQGSVFAYRSELDAWWESRRTRLAQAARNDHPEQPSAAPVGRIGALAAEVLPHWKAVVAAALLGTGALVWLTVEQHPSWHDPLTSARYTRLPAFTRSNQAAAISPDGKLIAFTGSREGHTDAWVGTIGSDLYRNVTQGRITDLVNPLIRVVNFSPNSSLLSVWSRKPDGTRPSDVSLYAAPVAGGELTPYLAPAAEFAWSPDGRRLVYHTTAPGDPIFVRDGADSSARNIYLATAGTHCHFPVWSPDGRYIYFVRGVPPDDWDIWRIRPSGEGLEQITRHNSRISYPVMLDRRTLLYLLTDADGSGPWIYGLDVEQRTPHRISAGPENYTSLSASADSTRLVATVSTPQSSLWRIALSRDADHAAGPPSFILADSGTPRIGPGFLLFVSSRGGNEGLWTLVEGATRMIWSDPHGRIVGAPAIASDGRIAFTLKVASSTRLVVMDKDGAHAQTLAESLELQGSPVWAPDGESLLVAAVQSGQPHLMRISLKAQAPVSFVSEYSVDPAWSPDGQLLLYTGADVGTTFPLRAAAADGRPYGIPSVMLTRGGRRVGFLDDHGLLVVTRGEVGHKNLWLVDLSSGSERELAELPTDFVVGDFDIDRSRSEIVVERIEYNAYLALIERQR